MTESIRQYFLKKNIWLKHVYLYQVQIDTMIREYRHVGRYALQLTIDTGIPHLAQFQFLLSAICN